MNRRAFIERTVRYGLLATLVAGGLILWRRSGTTDACSGCPDIAVCGRDLQSCTSQYATEQSDNGSADSNELQEKR